MLEIIVTIFLLLLLILLFLLGIVNIISQPASAIVFLPFIIVIGYMLFFSTPIHTYFNYNTQQEIEDKTISSFITCSQVIIYQPNSTLESISGIDYRCKDEFINYYERTNKCDISIAWEQFKKYKINRGK